MKDKCLLCNESCETRTIVDPVYTIFYCKNCGNHIFFHQVSNRFHENWLNKDIDFSNIREKLHTIKFTEPYDKNNSMIVIFNKFDYDDVHKWEELKDFNNVIFFEQ